MIRLRSAGRARNRIIALESGYSPQHRGCRTSVRLRIGISTGPVIVGVIGRKKFAYDVWGEAVNIAWRLESSAKAGQIQISESTYERLKGKYEFEKNLSAEADGQNCLPTYWLGKRIETPTVIRIGAKIAA